MSNLDEIEKRLDDTVFAKAGDKANEYVHPIDVRLLIRAVRQLAKGRRYKHGRLDSDTWVPYDPDVLELIEGAQ